MEREVPFFCGEAVVSYRVADVANWNAKRVPPFCFALFRFAFRCFVSLRVASLCFVLFAPLCFTLLPGSGLGSFWVFDLFYFSFASFRFASFCLALFRFGLLCFALLCFILLGVAWSSLCFASFRFASVRSTWLCLDFISFASFCWDFSILLRFAS